MQDTVGNIFFHVCTYFQGQREYILVQPKDNNKNRIKTLIFSEPFKYYGWELSDEDLGEEEQDLAAEAENEEMEEEGEEEEEEEGEEGEEEEEVSMPVFIYLCFYYNSFILSLNISSEKTDFA